jgi:Ni/Fe-hydrogenase 1 B-type cytochrome subunit
MVPRIYLWEFPVRLVHWLNFLSILTLSFTGFYIGSPFLYVLPGEFFAMATMKFIHMVAAYLFTVSCLVRLYWAFVGNEHARGRVFFPFTQKRWKEVMEFIKYYLFMRKTLPYAPGHTASAALAYLGLFLLYLVEIVSGFSLYSVDGDGGMASVLHLRSNLAAHPPFCDVADLCLCDHPYLHRLGK